MNLIFCAKKNDAQISGIAFMKKTPVFEKNFECFQFICAGKIFKTVCRKFLKAHGSRDILTFGDFIILKFAFHQNVNNKTQTLKNQENPGHHFGDKYCTNHLINHKSSSICKIGLNPKEFELLA